MKRKFIKAVLCGILVSAFLMPGECQAKEGSEQLPYDTYIYDYYDNVRYTPAAYVPDRELDGKDWPTGGLKEPQDFYITEDGMVYIADTGNSRIVVLNGTEYVREITTFKNNGREDHFLTPKGVYVSLNGDLYVADTGNNRVVGLNENDEAIRLIENPKSEVLEDGFVFTPNKVAVDYADRVFVIAQNMYQGIMAFDEGGDFTGFVGTVNVKISLYERFWKKFSTKAQRAQQKLFIPTEFTGMDIDPDGFIYATNVDPDSKQSVRRLNPRGEDVIRSNGKELSGDRKPSTKGDYAGPSLIVDVVIRDRGIYSMLDSKRGRIFTYDSEGTLLYIFGGIGTQKGSFRIPSAIENLGENIWALDSGNSGILIYKPTEYGSWINQAIGYRYDGAEAKAVDCWKKVLKMDANFEPAHDGIGKSHLAAGDNKLAMECFEKGRNQAYYSIAFRRYRNEFLKANLPVFMTVIILAGAAYVIWRRRKRG